MPIAASFRMDYLRENSIPQNSPTLEILMGHKRTQSNSKKTMILVKYFKKCLVKLVGKS